MSNIDKQELREAAEKATSGKWERGDGNGNGGELLVYCDDALGSAICEMTSEYNAIPKYQRINNLNFIAAANPATVLALLDELEAAKQDSARWFKAFEKAVSVGARYEERIAELTGENEYIRKRFKESDLLFGKNLLVMQAAIIEWQGTGDAKKGLAWIYNTLWGPGELPDEAEKDAQAYFDRKYAPLDEELMALHQWFWEQSEAERAAAACKGE